MRFQDLFHSPPGVLFAFPSRYWFTIGRQRVFSLGGWSPHLRTGFHVSRPMDSGGDDPCGPGFPIRKSSDQSSLASSPRLIAGCNVLRRLLSPRHPPHALVHLTL